MEMTAQPSLLGELEAAIQSGSSDKRTEMLRRVTDLFVSTAPYVTTEQAGVFDDVFEHLIKEIEWKAMVELSDRVAVVDNAPDRLIRRLAHDDAIEISGPVLAHSGRLGDDELVAIARTKSQAHLAAIAGRAELGEQITDVLVERGDMTVARKVAANDGARFTEISLRNLVGRASDDGDLASAVARRRELPAPMFRNLLARATDAVRKRLLDSAQPNTQAMINKILAEVSHDVEEETAPKRNYDSAKRLVMEMQKQGGLAAANLLQLAKTRKVQELVVALSLMTGVPIEVIDRFLDDPSDDPLLVLCRAIDLDWNTTAAVLAARLDLPQLPEGDADVAGRKYRKLTTSSAQRVIRFWQAREKLAAAG
jgi:uncharacterized protein (DUF2336 family)